MTVDYAAPERQIRSLLPDSCPTIGFGFNCHAANQEDPHTCYASYLWDGELAREQAISLNRVWTVRTSGSGGLVGSSLADQIGCLMGDEDTGATIEWRALDDELRRLLPNRRIGINLELNYHASSGDNPYWAYENFKWPSEEAVDQAIEANSVWTVEIYGHGIEPPLLLAASSLEGVIGFLKGKRDVILASQKRERSTRMSPREISEMLLRSQCAPTFTVERKVRRGGRNTVEVVVERKPKSE